MREPISDFQFDETILETKESQKKLSIKVPIGLVDRRIYVYLEAQMSIPQDFLIQAEVIIKREGTVLGKFPASIADLFTTGQIGDRATQSFACLVNAGGTPVGDSLVVNLVQPLTANTLTAILQPLRINCEIDEIELVPGKIRGTSVTAWRAYLACLSTK